MRPAPSAEEGGVMRPAPSAEEGKVGRPCHSAFTAAENLGKLFPPHSIAPVLLPAPHMGDREALHEGRQIAIVLGPHKEVPVVRHQRNSVYSHW